MKVTFELPAGSLGKPKVRRVYHEVPNLAAAWRFAKGLLRHHAWAMVSDSAATLLYVDIRHVARGAWLKDCPKNLFEARP